MFNIFNKNKNKRNSKTENKEKEVICFKDVKNNILKLNDIDDYLILDINDNICYFDREQLRVLIELLHKFSQGESIKTIIDNLNAEKEEDK